MKNRKVIKSIDNDILNHEMALVNSYTRRELTRDEVYIFSVVLCDNDVDRDYERFTVESLFALEKLFVGKTGIIDHNPSAKNQMARIISCRVEAVEGRKTLLGDQFFRLTARAYIRRTDGNREFIEAIEAGIVKEVSVSCSSDHKVCSVCHNDMHSQMCSHIKGREYDGVLCCGELINVTDAYEWSFVAVPAQRAAGVIKAQLKIAKHDEEKRIVYGWAYQCKDKNGEQMIDHSGDIVDSAVLEDAAYRFVELYRDGSDNHERGGVGILVESMMFTPEKTMALGIPDGTLPTGWWVGFRIIDPDVWEKIKDGTYSMFSIEGTAHTIPID